METRQLRVGVEPDRDPAIAEAARLLRAGELVAFPTETVYGLGGDALSEVAIEKIFAAKERPSDNPLIVHLADRAQVERFSTYRSSMLDDLTAAFWPGPLTLVLPAHPRARATITRGLETVALRVPNHPVALALLRACGLGVAAPSANRSGRPSPTQASHVYDDLQGRIPLILDGGSCRVGIESTVLDLSGEEPIILRPGTVTAAELAVVLGHEPALSSQETAHLRSPGTRYRHYSPDMPVYLIDATVPDEVLAAELTRLAEGARIGYLGPRTPPAKVQARKADAASFAVQLYGCLRQWEHERAAMIFVDLPAELGPGVRDRIDKAATAQLDTAALRGLRA